MTICTNCGAVMLDEDSSDHKCKAENLPTRGKERIPNSTEKNVKEA